MGRPEPSVLFVQTFVHPQLDEYVDEVLFAEPVVITACEFLEQNATSTSQAVTHAGATLPPSFALEVFVQCEGETRFRRLCQPFLYSHSSPNVLEVEAIVTNHLVVRGSYRSLSMVIYGNTAEDLGQFNIGFDDNSLTNLVNSAEGKLEDLPLALRSTNTTTEEPIWGVKTLSLPAVASDISVDTKQFLHLLVKMLELPKLGDAQHKLVSILVSIASSFVSCKWGKSKDSEGLPGIINEAKEDLLELYKVCLHESGDVSIESSSEFSFLESEVDSFTSKELVDMLSKYFHFSGNSSNFEYPWTSKNTKVILGLSVALLLCSGKDSFFHVINGGGMEQILHVLDCGMQNSTTIKLLLLGVVEQATRHSFGCEGFLGWWPREDENVPSGSSKSYSCLLNLLLQKPRHDIASLATYVLHRLRFYEVASRYECAVLSILGGLSTSGRITSVTLDMLVSAKTQLKQLLKLMNSRGPIEDPSPAASATITLILGQADGPMSYKATSGLISVSKCSFSNWDVDLHLLTLLKERGFLPLSSALLSSPLLHSEVGHAIGLIVDIASSIEAIILALLFCRSGLIFLLNHPEISTTIIHALKGAADANQEECVTLRYASVLISNGFFCDPMEVAMIVRMHLRMVNAIDRLLASNPQSEEFLWVLWELCGLSRSDCGRQALLVLTYFPEAIKILIEALHSVKESEPVTKNSGASPLNLAIFHSASEIFEVIVTDSTASSLGSWIEHAMELHKALHTSSPGSTRKDTPTRLLEWIDAGVVYQKNGVIGLLCYAAVLVSGGDAHLTLTSILGPDLTDAENVVGDSSGSDANILENLGKIISEKAFEGVSLRDSSIAQLTTAFRILAYISENKTIASNLYDEGAVAVIYTVLVNSRFMLERSSNSYDYLVDESAECNSTSDLLLERNRERSLVDLLVPCLVLLVTLLRSLQEAKEQHRNTKLMNALLRLHREVSPKLAACASDLSSPYPDSAFGFGAICHLVASALACWPVFGWTPGLFSSLLSSVQPTSLLALGSKETCSLLCLLNDLFPEEDLLLWKSGLPLLSPLKKLAVGTLLGTQKERQVNWYLEPAHHEKLLNQLSPNLDKISHVIQHYAISTLVVIQDMLRVLIIRIACKRPQSASILLRPIMTWISARVSDTSLLADTDDYKIYGYLDFLASLLEHPQAKALVLKEGVSKLLIEVLDKCFEDIESGGKQAEDERNSAKWCLPVFKCFSSLSSSRPYQKHREKQDSHSVGCLSTEDCSLILPCILQFCQVLPHGKELASCLTAFRDLGSCDEGRSALAAVVSDISSIKEQPESFGEDRRDGNYESLNRLCLGIHPPLLYCWKKLLSLVDPTDHLPDHVLEAISALSSGSLRFCMNGTGIEEVKFLFGLPNNVGGTNSYPEENISYIHEMIDLLNSKTATDEHLSNSNMPIALTQVLGFAKSLLLLLENPTGSVKVDNISLVEDFHSSSIEIRAYSAIHQMVCRSAEKVEDYLSLGGLGENFQWECPESLPDRLGSLPAKRKMASVEGGPIRRGRGENPPPEITSQNTFSRGTVSSAPPSVGPTRRDTFRQRKPNTSRPPSMHVDDYVARERSVDVVTNSNVIAIQRVGSSSGRPPSIHVDEFMARHRERQNPMATPIVGEAAASSQSKGSGAHPRDMETEKFDKPKQLKTNLDDDLQGIDIVFDGEESETDDRLPFPQLDDNLLQQLGPVMVEHSSPHSIVEETESDANESSQFSHMGGTPLASTNVDENTPSEFSSRMSVSRPGMPLLTREPSVSSDKKYFETSDDLKSATPVRNNNQVDSPAANLSSGFPASRTNFQNFYHRNSPQHMGNVPPLAAGSQGLYDQRFLPSQPPLPPARPPLTVAPMMSQTLDLVPAQSSPFINPMIDAQQQPFSSMYQVQTDYLSAYNSSKKSSSSPGGSARLPPPLPPTPPPFSSGPYNNLSSIKTSVAQSSGYNQPSVGTTELLQTDSRLGGTSASGARPPSYPLPLAQPMIYNRPGLYGNIPAQQQSENQPSILQNLSGPPSSMQSMHSLVQLQPLQPPQIPRPQVPPQHLRPPIQQLEQGGPSLQNPAQMQLHQLQMLQQPHVSPIPYYQSQQPVELSPAPLQQVQNQSGDGGSQSQQDSGMSLHEYFKSPEAIQSLLSDREKLCQLLEQHPKLMLMLQERLGQL